MELTEKTEVESKALPTPPRRTGEIPEMGIDAIKPPLEVNLIRDAPFATAAANLLLLACSLITVLYFPASR